MSISFFAIAMLCFVMFLNSSLRRSMFRLPTLWGIYGSCTNDLFELDFIIDELLLDFLESPLPFLLPTIVILLARQLFSLMKVIF